jgi:hypothetical protein
MIYVSALLCINWGWLFGTACLLVQRISDADVVSDAGCGGLLDFCEVGKRGGRRLRPVIIFLSD